MERIPDTVRIWIIPVSILILFFFLPLHCFIIGDNQGFGIQGAVFRYQETENGISFIPVTYEIGYVTSGIYQGKTALSVIFWVTATLILVCTLMVSIIYVNRINPLTFEFIILGITSSSILYLGSLFFQYGIFFSGPAGISLPAGILIMALFAVFLYFNESIFRGTNT